MNKLVNIEDLKDAIMCLDWYHQNQRGEMVHGANDDEHQAWYKAEDIYKAIECVPSAQTKIAENLYLYKCFITDKDGLQHEVIHTGDIRRVTGWEI